MKKMIALLLALSLMLCACGSKPAETTAPTTAATTAPTTMPTTEATDASTDTTGTLEGAMDDILGGSTDDATGPNGSNGNGGAQIPSESNRSRGTVMPRK